MKTLRVESARQWREWLDAHYASATEIWLVFYKRHTGVASIAYSDALVRGAQGRRAITTGGSQTASDRSRLWAATAPACPARKADVVHPGRQRAETKRRRLKEAIRLLAGGNTLGLK